MDYTAIATYLKKHYDQREKGRCCKHHLPIKKVDGVPCHVYIEMRHLGTHDLLLNISNRTLQYYSHVDSELFYYMKTFCVGTTDDETASLEKIIVALKLIYAILPQLKFCKYNGEFKTDTDTDTALIPFWKHFLQHENVEADLQDCCVCQETTICHTDCGHRLCYKCWENIQANGFDSFLECPIYPCPLCREPLRKTVDVD